MYFAILWNHSKLSLAELKLCKPTNITRKKEYVLFETDHPEILDQLWGIVKRWVMHKQSDLPMLCTDVQLLWTNSQHLWMLAKKQHTVKRFKLIEIKKSDLDVKQSGVELIDFWRQWIGKVHGRQEIDLPAMIDFDKPVNGMQIGMMPSKLVKVLVNIGRGGLPVFEETPLTIRDPFCGFGTTCFVVQGMGYHTIWSDINIASAKQNKKRWLKTPYAQEWLHMTLFEHDVTKAFTQPFLTHVDLIVSEGRLWPVVKQWTVVRGEWRTVQTSDSGKKANDRKKIAENIEKIVTVYEWFFGNVMEFYGRTEKNESIPTIVITVPHYTFLDDDPIWERVIWFLDSLWVSYRSVGIYKRKGQLVARRVVMVAGHE